jgi:hypothetical protein
VLLKPNHSFVDLLQVGVEHDRATSESTAKSERLTKVDNHRLKRRMDNRLAFDQLCELARLGRDLLLYLKDGLAQLGAVDRLCGDSRIRPGGVVRRLPAQLRRVRPAGFCQAIAQRCEKTGATQSISWASLAFALS